jgi:hypothetical protein
VKYVLSAGAAILLFGCSNESLDLSNSSSDSAKNSVARSGPAIRARLPATGERGRLSVDERVASPFAAALNEGFDVFTCTGATRDSTNEPGSEVQQISPVTIGFRVNPDRNPAFDLYLPERNKWADVCETACAFVGTKSAFVVSKNGARSAMMSTGDETSNAHIRFSNARLTSEVTKYVVNQFGGITRIKSVFEGTCEPFKAAF